VYPGLAVAAALLAEDVTGTGCAPETTFVGGEGEAERDLTARAGVRFVAVPSGGLHGVGVWNAVRGSLKLMRGWVVAYGLARKQRPDAVFVTGGYASVPVALAAWSLGVPLMVYLPDIEPGLAVRFIARFATRVAVTVAESAAYFEGKDVLVSGYPLRAEFEAVTQSVGREMFDLRPTEPVVLVLGGSRGSRSINEALDGTLDQLLEIAQVLHVTGTEDWPRVSAVMGRLAPSVRARYHAYPYLHQGMGSALAAADLVVARAGASTLGELPACGVPAILVPYPHAWRYQRVNADWLVGRGAAVRLDDERLGEDLGATISGLLRDRPRLTAMAARMAALARPDATRQLARQLYELAGWRGSQIHGTA
jgi:UDP-N-acetylglucosamine--N-acetylmuramyl-(pentapeptide) pyrophosphoryl-undecaprenol N-acetylglucosamine transferase